MSLRRMKHEIVEELKAELYNIIEEALVEESKTVKINGLEWMTTNLDDVISVPLIKDKKEWEKAGEEGKPACCYNNQRGKGVLYNWFALKHLEKGGWRVPTEKDWNTLQEDKQELLDLGWNPQYDGYRDSDGSFDDVGNYGYWWSGKASNASDAWYRALGRTGDDLSRFDYPKGFGFSVRLVK